MPRPTHQPWFAAKRFGIGASVPIAWQGWASVAVLGAAIGLAARLLHGGSRAAVVVAACAAFCAVAARRTRGGWRWDEPDA